MHAIVIFLLILVGVWLWTNLTKRGPGESGSLRRTPKWRILARLTCIPIMVMLVCAAFFMIMGKTDWALAFDRRWFNLPSSSASGCCGVSQT